MALTHPAVQMHSIRHVKARPTLGIDIAGGRSCTRERETQNGVVLGPPLVGCTESLLRGQAAQGLLTEEEARLGAWRGRRGGW